MMSSAAKNVRGLSLYERAVQLGICFQKPDFTMNVIEAAILEYHRQHGTYPQPLNGDATAYFGYPETWAAVDCALVQGIRGLPGKDSLFQVAFRLGLVGGKPSLTIVKIQAAITAFHKDQGTHPNEKSGDATAYFGYPETWSAVQAAAYHGVRGLPGGSTLITIAREMGLVKGKPPLNMPLVKKAISSFYKEHGIHPNGASGDATAYFGYSETWGAVQSALKKGYRGLPGGKTLVEVAIQMGLHQKREPLTKAILRRAIHKFYDEHGFPPTAESGDATAYFGYQVMWRTIDSCIRYGNRGLSKGGSLAQVVRDMKLRLVKPPLSEEIVGQAISSFRSDHGKIPHEKSGDATAYFGYPETWSAVGSCCRLGLRGLPGGTTLAKMAKRRSSP